MAESTIVKVPRDGTIVLKDNGGANSYTVAYEDGNVSFGRQKDERIIIRDRGSIVASRKGDSPHPCRLPRRDWQRLGLHEGQRSP